MNEANASRWCVLIEEGVGHYGYWRMTRQYNYPDRETALAMAEEAAWSYRPYLPYRRRRRCVFRGNDGSYVVWLQGPLAAFHFRVSVMEWLGEAPA